MTGLDLPAAGRALSAPLSAVRAARHLSRGALDNAGRSLGDLRRAVTDRLELASGRTGDDALPGDLETLDPDTCWDLLARARVGRLAYIARAGSPDIAPVNYVVDGRCVLLRSGVGPKLQAAERRDLVAFEVDEVDEDAHSGWSVVVYGRAVLVRPEESVGVEPLPWAVGPRRHLVRVVPTRITGRRLHGDKDDR